MSRLSGDVRPVLGGVAATLAFAHLGEAPPPHPPAGRFVVDAPEGWAFHSWGWPVPSPDGSQIVFRAAPEGATDENASAMLWTRSLEAVSARLLAGTEGAEGPFWSPDGQFVGFFAQRELRKLSLANGTIQRICAMPGPANGGADWGVDGRIIFTAGAETPDRVYTVAAAGGEPEPLTSTPGPAPPGVMAIPQFLKGEQDFTFLSIDQGDTPPGVYVSSLGAPDDRRRLLDGIARLQHAAGQAFFVQGASLLAQPFDTRRAELTGQPVAIASSVGTWSQNPGIGWFGVSPGGTLAYLTGLTVSGDVQLTWLDRRGNPVWSPDGRSLAFSALKDGTTQTGLRRKGLRAGDPETVIVDTEDQDYPEAWSRDGRALLFVRRTSAAADAQQSIWTVSSEEGGEPEALENSGFFVDEPQISPDGRWLAYNSMESGRSEVYVEPYRRDGERVRVSIDGGGQPKWRGDGKELFLTSLDGHLMSVAFRDRSDRAEVDLPTTLFEIGSLQGPDYDDYAPSADGQRFLVKVAVDQGQRTQMHVITNWPSLLE